MNPGDWLLAAEPAQLLPARSQMAFTLAFHIILVPIGVALPAILLIANYRGLRRSDPVALTLARRWSHALALTFAVGAVSGTVLSFEMGMLWPGLTDTYGDVFGLPFAMEGVAFFIEAILIAIYIYGWRRLKPWTHFWLGVPIPFVSLFGAFSIISANAWMNMPAGFVAGPNGEPTNIDPIGAIFNDALPYEFVHFVIGAYMAAGFTVASIYTVGWLRGRRDRYHRLGILIPFTVAAIATPLQFVAGDSTARAVYKDQPAKFAAMEVVTQTGTDQTEIIFGRYDETTNTVAGGIRIPGLNSILAGFSRDTNIQGLDAFALEDRPSNVNVVHWAFDTMVTIACVLILIVLLFAFTYWRRRAVPRNRPLLWLVAASGVLTYIAIEAGWFVTEVGRQPWVVYGHLRTSDAVTQTPVGTVRTTFTIVMILYALLAIGTVAGLRSMSRRWRRQDEADDTSPYGPRPAPEGADGAVRPAGADGAGPPEPVPTGEKPAGSGVEP